MTSFVTQYLEESIALIQGLDHAAIDCAAEILAKVRERGGRLFLLGSGGGAGHASHAVCDFRKICNIDAYAPYDNVSELTARVNDEGWDTTIVNWLKVTRMNEKDGLLVFSVGGGNEEKNISANLVNAIKAAKSVGASVVGIVGKDGGYTKIAADVAVVIPVISPERITPHTEGFQAVIWHLLVSHPHLQINKTKWESTK